MTLISGSVNGVPLATLTDGNLNYRWQWWQDNSVWWFGTGTTVQIDLGREFVIDGAKVQADSNDVYRLEYLDAGDGQWKVLWDVPDYSSRGGYTITRPDYGWSDSYEWEPVGTVTTSKVRLSAVSGDNAYALQELQLLGHAVGTTGQDFHTFTLNSGQSATVALTSLTGGSVGVTLLDKLERRSR